jgi:hypothetical protein
VNECLKRINFGFQRQPYDHVLREEECEQAAIVDVAEYIARNPERKELVAVDGFAGCMSGIVGLLGIEKTSIGVSRVCVLSCVG